MTNIYKLLITFFLLLYALPKAEAQTEPNYPTFNMTVKNIATSPGPNGRDSLLFFDVYMQQTNFGQPGVDPFEFCCAQYAWLFNRNITDAVLPPGPGQPNSSLVASAFIPSYTPLLPPTSQILQDYDVANQQSLLQFSGNLPNSAMNYFISSVFPGTFMMRVRMRTPAHRWNLVPLNLKFKLGAAPNTFVAYFMPFADTVDTDVFPPPAQFAQALMDTVVNQYSVEDGVIVQTPIANFYSNTRTVNPGESVNFQDSSLRNPTSWSWSFPGGTPSSSTQQNPSGIVYSTPGSYSVTLTATNTNGPNTITKNNYITVGPPPCIPDWLNTIKIADAANVKDSLYFGTSPFATNEIDTCFGEQLLPPPPPTGAFDIRFILPNAVDASKKDFRSEPLNDIFWTIKFQPSSAGYPFTIMWDRNAFPETGLFYLKDIGGGSIVNVDMSSTGTYTLTNLLVTSLIIEFRYLLTISVPYNTNWNMLSIPLRADNMAVNRVFPNAASLAYTFNGSTYVTADTFKIGAGYWLKFNQDSVKNYVGLAVSPKNIPVITNWNMIGPFDENIPVSSIISVPSGIVISQFYGFTNNYVVADTLKKGRSYWVKSSAPGTLMKNTADNIFTNITASDSLDDWTRISISNSENLTTNLYLVNSNQISQNYELPPVPPQGIFDIRFGSDKTVESFGQNHTIRLSSSALPLKINVYNLNNNRLRLRDALGGSMIDMILEEGVELEINQSIDNLMLIEESILPDTYSLSQNYPNPFNPSTTIKYELPMDGFVKIIIYDVLGKEVQNIVNTSQKAGNYEVKFNASNLASGVYFYKMQSGQFSEIRRMLLLK